MEENKLVLSLSKLKRLRHSVMHTQNPDLLKHANLAPGGHSKTDRHSQSIERNILKKIYLDKEIHSNNNQNPRESIEKNENYIKTKNSTKYTSDIQEPFPLLSKLTSRLAPNNSKGFINNVMENYKVYSDVIHDISEDLHPKFQLMSQQEKMKIRERKEWSEKHIPQLINTINHKENLKTKIISRLEMNTMSSEYNSIRPIKPLNVKGEKLEKLLILNRNLIKQNKQQKKEKKIEILSKKIVNQEDEELGEVLTKVNDDEELYITSSNLRKASNNDKNDKNDKSETILTNSHVKNNFSIISLEKPENFENQENYIKSCSSIKSVHLNTINNTITHHNSKSKKINTSSNGHNLYVKKNELKDKIFTLNPNPSSVVSSNGFENCSLQTQIEDLFHYNNNTNRGDKNLEKNEKILTLRKSAMTSRGNSTTYSPNKKLSTFENFKSLSLINSERDNSNFNNSKINYSQYSFSPNQKHKKSSSINLKSEKLEKKISGSNTNKPNFERYKYEYSVHQKKNEADKKIMKKFSDFMDLKNREKVIKHRMATKLSKDNLSLRYAYNLGDTRDSQSLSYAQTAGQEFYLKNLKNFKIKSHSKSQENFFDLKFKPKVRDSNKTVSVMTMTLTENYEK